MNRDGCSLAVRYFHPRLSWCRRPALRELVVDRAVADDGTHRPVYLAAADAMRIDPERPTVYTNVWSHQLGGRGRGSRAVLAYLHCFGPGHVRPLSEAVAAEYALDHRARPAHLEALGGRGARHRRVFARTPHRNRNRNRNRNRGPLRAPIRSTRGSFRLDVAGAPV